MAPSPTTDAITGADLNRLPVDRAVRLIEPAKQLPYTNPALLDVLAERLQTLRTIDPLATTRGVVVHDDVHLNNIVGTGSHIVWPPSVPPSTLPTFHPYAGSQPSSKTPATSKRSSTRERDAAASSGRLTPGRGTRKCSSCCRW